MATKVFKIEVNNLEEAMKEINNIISEELEEKEDKECENCEHKEQCEKEKNEKKGLEILKAIFNLLKVTVKEEHQEMLENKYKDLLKEEYAWIIGHVLSEIAEDVRYAMFSLLMDKEVKKQLTNEWLKNNKRKC